MLLSRQTVGTYLELSSHAAHQGTLSHSHLSLLSHSGLILAQRVEIVCANLLLQKKKKKAQAGNEWLNSLPNSSHTRKKPPHSKWGTNVPFAVLLLSKIPCDP